MLGVLISLSFISVENFWHGYYCARVCYVCLCGSCIIIL